MMDISESWDSGLEERVIRPIAAKAILFYADKIINQHRKQLDVKIDDYEVTLIRNNILTDSIYFDLICPESRHAKYMINVEVKINERRFVGLFYMLKGGEWIDDRQLNKMV